MTSSLRAMNAIAFALSSNGIESTSTYPLILDFVNTAKSVEVAKRACETFDNECRIFWVGGKQSILFIPDDLMDRPIGFGQENYTLYIRGENITNESMEEFFKRLRLFHPFFAQFFPGKKLRISFEPADNNDLNFMILTICAPFVADMIIMLESKNVYHSMRTIIESMKFPKVEYIDAIIDYAAKIKFTAADLEYIREWALEKAPHLKEYFGNELKLSFFRAQKEKEEKEEEEEEEWEEIEDEYPPKIEKAPTMKTRSDDAVLAHAMDVVASAQIGFNARGITALLWSWNRLDVAYGVNLYARWQKHIPDSIMMAKVDKFSIRAQLSRIIDDYRYWRKGPTLRDPKYRRDEEFMIEQKQIEKEREAATSPSSSSSSPIFYSPSPPPLSPLPYRRPTPEPILFGRLEDDVPSPSYELNKISRLNIRCKTCGLLKAK